MSEKMNVPLALDPPSSGVTELADEWMARALVGSRNSPRKRVILPFHKEAGALLQRRLKAWLF
ncbi:MAG: hypothetical protein V5783_07790 [Pontiella sp.]